MKKVSFTIVMSLMLSFLSLENINAQNNKIDKNGLRQGIWTDYHENGKVRYTGQFKDNKPVGEFLYYSEDGKLTAKNKYLTDGYNETEMYSANEKIIAKGKYLNKKKDGFWYYFSENDGSIILMEEYKNGVLNGKAIVYIPETATASEITNYIDGVRQGEYVKCYDNGELMVKANYKDDKLDGDYVYYYSNGVVKEEGRFVDGMKIGEWKTYDIEGNVISTDNHEEENYDNPELEGVDLN